MKKLFAFTLLLAASMSFAQQSTGSGANADKKPQGQRKAGTKTPSAVGNVSLNPQPLPPKQANGPGASAESKVALNPQPLPPGAAKGGKGSAESKVALNPQPLPPGAKMTSEQKKAKNNKKVNAK